MIRVRVRLAAQARGVTTLPGCLIERADHNDARALVGGFTSVGKPTNIRSGLTSSPLRADPRAV